MVEQRDSPGYRKVNVVGLSERAGLSSLASDASGQLDVFGHDGDSLGVNGTQISIFEETNQVCLARFLKCSDSGALKSEISLKILSYFANKTLERSLADEQLGALLIATNLAQRNRAWSETVCLHNAVGRRTRYA